MSWDECSQALQEGFSILPILGPRDIRTEKKAVFVAAKTRENTASMTTEHKFLGRNRGDLCVKELR